MEVCLPYTAEVGLFVAKAELFRVRLLEPILAVYGRIGFAFCPFWWLDRKMFIF